MNTAQNTAQNTDTLAVKAAKSFDAAWDAAAERGERVYAWAKTENGKDKIKKGVLASALVGIGALLGAAA